MPEAAKRDPKIVMEDLRILHLQAGPIYAQKSRTHAEASRLRVLQNEIAEQRGDLPPLRLCASKPPTMNPEAA